MMHNKAHVPYVFEDHPSKNHSARESTVIDTIVFHYTVSNLEKSLATLDRSTAAQVSAHSPLGG